MAVFDSIQILCLIIFIKKVNSYILVRTLTSKYKLSKEKKPAELLIEDEFQVDGSFTLGENLADNVGQEMAYLVILA